MFQKRSVLTRDRIMWIMDNLVVLSSILSSTIMGERIICIFFSEMKSYFLFVGADEFDVIHDLPNTQENMWKKAIVQKFRLKYFKSNSSGHNYFGHIYFKQVKSWPQLFIKELFLLQKLFSVFWALDLLYMRQVCSCTQVHDIYQTNPAVFN